MTLPFTLAFVLALPSLHEAADLDALADKTLGKYEFSFAFNERLAFTDEFHIDGLALEEKKSTPTHRLYTVTGSFVSPKAFGKKPLLTGSTLTLQREPNAHHATGTFTLKFHAENLDIDLTVHLHLSPLCDAVLVTQAAMTSKAWKVTGSKVKSVNKAK